MVAQTSGGQLQETTERGAALFKNSSAVDKIATTVLDQRYRFL